MAESLGQRIFVICTDKAEAHAWGRRNRPQCHVKVAHPDSHIAPRGLYIPEETVYVLDPPSERARNAWIQTKAKLVYL